MQTMTQTEARLEFTETLSTGMRVFLFILGLFPWLAPYELLIKPGWSEFSLVMLFFLSISLGAIAVSFGFIGAALFGLNQTIIFDLKDQTVTHRYESAVNALRTKRYAFRDIIKTEVREHDWENGPDTYSLEIHFADGHKILCGDFSSRQEAENIQTQIHWQ
ncbi:MAG: hypothetical protein ACOYYJ_00060 [Chloroflexota bacterium]